MADELLNDGDDDIFVYTGGRAPRDVRRAKIDESIDTIPRRAFYDCEELIEVEGHNKLKKIEKNAFRVCRRLRRVTKMNGVIEIEDGAFLGCHALRDAELFEKLEIIGEFAFDHCRALMMSLNMPSIRRVGACAFQCCKALTDAVFGKHLGIIDDNAFNCCDSLRRIAIPLKRSLIIGIIPMPIRTLATDGENPLGLFDSESLYASLSGAFRNCASLSRVDAVGGIHKTISSLHMESWKDTMKEDIDRINQTLPDTPSRSREKTEAIIEWIDSVIDRMEHYKSEHFTLVKEAMTLLELALWKANLHENDGNESELTMVQRKKVRQERRITSGASIVIKNVLPFLKLK